MPIKDLSFREASLPRLKAGVDKLADAVKSTLGPMGRNVIIERAYGDPTMTKDGVSVAKEIELKDPVENLGAQMVKNASAKTADEAGDGTSTSAVLTQAIFSEGYKMLIAGAKPVELKRGMDKVRALLVESIKGMAIPVTTKEEMAAVASISANNDEGIGQLVADAIDMAGKNGVVTIDESASGETTVDVEEGFEFKRGWKDTSRHFTAQLKDGSETIVLNSPLFLFLNKDMNTITQNLAWIIQKATTTGRPLVIVAPNFNNTAITLLVQNLIKGNQVYAMMPAGFASDDKVIHLDDMACATGGTVFGPGAQPLPAKAEEVNLGYLGQADKATITKDTTTILGGKGNAEEIQQRLESLQNTIARTASDFDKEKLQERAGRLGGGIAVIRVGGNSEVEIKEIKDRVEDALHATRAAAADGIVPGGGVTLLRAKATVSGMDWGCENSDQVLGGNILLQALEAPIRCIVDNAGGKSDVVVDKIVRGEAPGYNAYTEVYEDLMEAGVVDPARVTTAALTNAVSIAGMLLTTSCAITIDRSMVTSDPNQGF